MIFKEFKNLETILFMSIMLLNSYFSIGCFLKMSKTILFKSKTILFKSNFSRVVGS